MAVKSSPTDTRQQVLCQLCTLPIRAAVYETNAQDSAAFCCAGCRNVWRILIESGKLSELSDPRDSPLYQHALAVGLIGNSQEAKSTETRVEVPEVTLERKGGTLDDNRQCVLQIGGMWCSSCSWLIEQTLRKSKGVVSAEVSFSSDTARVIYKPAKTDENDLSKRIVDLGYTAAALGEGNYADPRVTARRKDLLRVVICFAFAMNVMMMQLILYAGYFEGITKDIESGLPWLLLALSVPVVWSAWPIFQRAIKASAQGVATMETLVAVGSTAALGYSIWQTICGTGHVYYDTADMLLGLVMVGKYIERGARQNASDALTLLYGLLPKKAVLIRDGNEFPVAIGQIADGDRILVRTGERIAADGRVDEGWATVDESLLSGESRPINKRAGDQTIGGTMVLNGTLTVRVDRVGELGTLNQIIKHVEDAVGKKTPTEKMADRISRFFVPIVLSLAILSGLALAFVFHAGADVVMTRIVAVLVIACPCALGIATPMAISAGVAAAARSGILVADGGAFESLKQIRHIVLDKTGTATEATFTVDRVLSGELSGNLLSALESRSKHPIATAIFARFPDMPDDCPQVTDFQIDDGKGITGQVNGVLVFAGNEKAVLSAGLTIPDDLIASANDCESEGLTVIYWGIVNDRLLGALALGDKVRPEAKQSISELRTLGISIELLSGDSEQTTASVARQLLIEKFRGGASPTDKANLVESLRNSGLKVCMVGDGVNDAPALAQADVGIALASGTDIAARTAQVTLLKPDLTLLPKLVTLARRTITIMRMNLFWAFLYNTICIPLAILGYVTPLWAVVAMLISSLTVILNTQRLKRA